jgi:hypothetical protein
MKQKATAPGLKAKLNRPGLAGSCALVASVVFALTKLALPAAICSCATGSGDMRQIDPYPSSSVAGARTITNLIGGGTVTLSDSQLIDVVILGDGYTNGTSANFFADACTWYTNLFCATGGIHPYNAFAQAFRVHAVFNASSELVQGTNEPTRNTYYRLLVDPNSSGAASGLDTVSGWWNAVDDPGGSANADFRSRLYAAIDSVSNPVNLAKYPSSLVRPLPSDSDSGYFHDAYQDYLPAISNRYSNLIVVMMLKLAPGLKEGGATKQVYSDPGDPAGTRRVMVAFGENAQHEFGHAFADLFDEYIHSRSMDAHFYNPATPSVFLLWNVSFNNERCDLLWPHLAPGGKYNSEVRSPIGRLYLGGYCASNVWHSEYVCLMNGTHSNYLCGISSDATPVALRSSQLCFWCQEIVTVRILEKTGQFARAGDPSDINERGATWYQLWEDSLRDRYYQYFDVATRIAATNANYAAQGFTGINNSFINPPCLFECDIVEYGNAIYVDGARGASANSGSKSKPLDTLLNGITQANASCASLPLVAVQPASYPGAVTFSQRAILLTDGCTPVVIGK